MSYPEALKYLAKKYGIEIKERELSNEEKLVQGERESLFIVNQFARDYFQDILRNHVTAFVSCPDWVTARGMRTLGAPEKGDPRVISGESGAVTTGLVETLMLDPEYAVLKELIGLDKTSSVLCFSTEGDTDPDQYRRIVWEGEYPTC